MASSTFMHESGLVMAQQGDVLMLVVHGGDGTVTSARVWEKMKAWLGARIASAAKPVLVLMVVHESTASPDGPVRDDIQASLNAWGAKLRHLVSVSLGNSLRMSIVRGMTRAVMLLSGQSKRLSVAGTIDEGLEIADKHLQLDEATRSGLRTMLVEMLASVPSGVK